MRNDFFTRWDFWWCRSAPPHVMAILRIAFGLFLLIEAATYLPFVPEMFSKEGLVMSMNLSQFPDMFAKILKPPPVWAAWLFACAYVAALLMLITGTFMRAAIVILILLFWYYWQLSFHLFPSSYHRLFFFTLWVLLFSGADKTFSVRMFFKRGSFFAWDPISILPQRLISIQMTATYLGVGWQKLWLPTWQGGEVLPYSLITRWGSPSAFWMVSQNWPMWVYDTMNWTVKVFECLMPFGLWVPRLQWLFFAGGLVFHLSIAILLEIWWFLVLVPAYIVFLSPEDVYNTLKRHSRGRIP